MKHVFQDPDLIELDRIWPIGQLLEVPEHGSIIVAGAYHGRYIHYLSEVFPTVQIFGYEPQREAVDVLRRRFFLKNSKVFISGSGLATSNREVYLGRTGSDGASIMELGGAAYKVRLKDIAEEIQNRRDGVDLFLMNLEGSEWALIPYLLDEMMHHRIASIALQQHSKYASKERIARVKSYLAEYYDLIYSDGQVDGWEYWRRK